MKKILYFYLKGCPHCAKADRLLAELQSENPAYAGLTIERVEESEQPALAEQYDYYYVPCLWVLAPGEAPKKLHEGVSSKEKLKAVLDAALS